MSKYVCGICKKEFKTRKSFNFHSRTTKTIFIVYSDGIYVQMNLKKYLDILLERK